MKKSEMYKLTQKAVVNSLAIKTDDKLEILRVLMEDENTALWVEKREEKKADEAV